MKQRILAMGLAVVLAFSLVVFVGCSNSNNNDGRTIEEVVEAFYVEVLEEAGFASEDIEAAMDMIRDMGFFDMFEGMDVDVAEVEAELETIRPMMVDMMSQMAGMF